MQNIQGFEFSFGLLSVQTDTLSCSIRNSLELPVPSKKKPFIEIHKIVFVIQSKLKRKLHLLQFTLFICVSSVTICVWVFNNISIQISFMEYFPRLESVSSRASFSDLLIQIKSHGSGAIPPIMTMLIFEAAP